MEGLERPESARSIRPGKISQTFSRFKGIIRIPARKATPNATQKPPILDTKGRQNPSTLRHHPYQKTSTTNRESMLVKPYMSQPMLALQRKSIDTDPHSQPSDPDSETSSSPDPSPCRMNSEFPLPKQSDDSKRRSRRLSLHSLSSAPTEELGAQIQESNIVSPSPPTPPPKPPGHNHTPNFSLPRRLDASRRLSDNILPVEDSITVTQTNTTSTSTTPRPLPTLTTQPAPVSDTGTPSAQMPAQTTLGSGRAKPPRPVRPLPPVPCPEESPTRPSFARRSTTMDETTMPPAAPAEPIVRSASEADGVPAQRRDAPPKLTLPTTLNRRISLLQATGGAARLSPTIMHRPPPLPILNLPRLPVIQSASGSGGDVLPEDSSVVRRRSQRMVLGDMPALPIQGTNRGVGGHEEVDDMEEDDDDDDDDDEEEDEEEEGGVPRTSTSTESAGSGDGGGLFGRGSYDLADTALLRRPELPPLSLDSPFDVRFQTDFGSASTSGMFGGETGSYLSSDKKGKSKQVFPSLSSSGSTSTSGDSASASSASSMGVEFSRQQRPSLLVTTSNTVSHHSFSSTTSVTEYFDAHSRLGSDRTPSAQLSDPFSKAQSGSPLATPRAPHFEVPKVDVEVGAVNKNDGGRTTKTSTRNSNRDSMVFSNNANATLLVQRPSMYKRASRSMIDIHAVAKREEVEKIVREEEEQQERLRKRASIRNSVVIGNGGLAAGGVESGGHRVSMVRGDGLLPMEEEGTLPKTDGRVESATHRLSRTTATTTQLVSGGGPSAGGSIIEEPQYASDLTGLTLSVPVVSVRAVGGNNVNDGEGSRRSVVLDAVSASEATQKRQNRMSLAPAYDSLQPLQPSVRKRRSMPTFNEATAPPPYPSFAPRPFGGAPIIKISPREDEGREVLPPYSNSIFLKEIMPLKMEFSAPGVQARDRKWKRVLVVLEGTMLKVYRCPSGPGGVSAIEQWWESKVGAGDVAPKPQAASASSSAARSAAGAAATPERREEEARARAEEKMQQQYVVEHTQDDSRGDGGVQSSSQAAQAFAAASLAHRPSKESTGSTQIAITKSALNIAVQFLKPGSRHMRSNSDSGPPSPSMMAVPLGAPRPSLNLPRPGQATPTSSTFTGSSRSQSPMPSSSSMTAQASGSHSPMPSSSRPSSRLNVQSTSSSVSSRPTTPNTGGSGRSSRMRPGRQSKSEFSKPQPHDLIRCYTMQNAESGLGNDYVKRKNVIRVRLEGEQFLLQAKDIPSVVQWIEGLQAASNVALDLDERPMPRGPIFPRRRRRRRPNVTPILTNTGPPRPATVVETYTPTSATAGQPALRRTA